MSQSERFYLKTELRALGGDDEDEEDEFAVEGYAATFGSEADLGDFRERCAPTAFVRALNEGQDVRCLRNHDPNFVLGRVKNGTLKLRSDNRGLKFRCELDRNNPEHRATHAMVKRGDLDGCSFAFLPKQQEWSDATDERTGNRYALRTLVDVDLQDTSVVTYPAYTTGTSVQARSALWMPNGVSAEIRSAVARFTKVQNLRTNSDNGPSEEELRRTLKSVRLF